MDPADIHHALSRHGALLGQHKQLLQALVENRTHVAKAVADLMQQSCPILPPTIPYASTISTSQRTSSTHICDPESFHGDLDKCQEFLLQYWLVFQQKARLFSNDFSKVFYLGGLLQGKELAWAEAVSSHNCLETMTYAELEGSLKAVFDHPDQPGDATTRLLSLHQGKRSVADFLEF